MFLIFGIQEIKRTSKDRSILKGPCPRCRAENLNPITYRNWFTLFFIPVIPLGAAKPYYECRQCKQIFDESIETHMHQPAEETYIEIPDNQLVTCRATIAGMTYLAITNGYISTREEKKIQDTIAQFKEFNQELNSIKASIVSHGNKENQVFEYLYDAKDALTKTEVKELLMTIATIFSGHSVSKEQEILMKDFLIALGIPKESYTNILRNL